MLLLYARVKLCKAFFFIILVIFPGICSSAARLVRLSEPAATAVPIDNNATANKKFFIIFPLNKRFRKCYFMFCGGGGKYFFVYLSYLL